MTDTIARIKKAGLRFEINVDLNDALKMKKGELDNIEVASDTIFTDIKKGERASESDLNKAFGTTDIKEIAKNIIKSGEVQTTQEHRDAEQEKKFKQVVNFLVVNTMDPKTGNPHTPNRIESALDEAKINIKNVPVEHQINEILEKIQAILPMKLDVKKVKVTIPAIHTGKAYGVVNQYKGVESWKDDGSLEILAEIPTGLLMDFYDKLNSVTHGSALTEEIKE